jgi:hypothetical protein
MIAGTIWNQLVSTLQENPTLKKYVKFVYEGVRDISTMDRNSLPCIMLEPVRDGDIEKDMNQVKRIYFSGEIYALSSNNFSEFPKTIVGGQDYKGILDINNDIRACLQGSNTLGDRVIDLQMDPTLYDRIDNKYPVRGLVIPFRILYQQNNGV